MPLRLGGPALGLVLALLAPTGTVSADVVTFEPQAPCPPGASRTWVHSGASDCVVRRCGADGACPRGPCRTRRYCVPRDAPEESTVVEALCDQGCTAEQTCRAFDICFSGPPPTSGPLAEAPGPDDLAAPPSHASARGCSTSATPAHGGWLGLLVLWAMFRARTGGTRRGTRHGRHRRPARAPAQNMLSPPA